jgi:hypothetical protein
MTDQDPSVNPDDGVSDEDEAAIDEALDALTATATIDEDDDDMIVEDEVGEDEIADEADFDEDDDEPELDEEDVGELAPHEITLHVSEPDDEVAADEVPAGEVIDEPAIPAVAVVAAAPTAEEQRLAQLEQVAQALTAAAVKRDNGRVRRKVSASATGAALVGAIPVLLQLVDALNLSPELAATVSAAAATIASFLSGYVTPERPPSVEPELASQVLKQP